MSQALSSSICSTMSGECRSVFLLEQHLPSELNCVGGFNMLWKRANHNLMILLVLKVMKSIIKGKAIYIWISFEKKKKMKKKRNKNKISDNFKINIPSPVSSSRYWKNI